MLLLSIWTTSCVEFGLRHHSQYTTGGFSFYPHRFQLFHSPQHSWGIRLFIYFPQLINDLREDNTTKSTDADSRMTIRRIAYGLTDFISLTTNMPIGLYLSILKPFIIPLGFTATATICLLTTSKKCMRGSVLCQQLSGRTSHFILC